MEYIIEIVTFFTLFDVETVITSLAVVDIVSSTSLRLDIVHITVHRLLVDFQILTIRLVSI